MKKLRKEKKTDDVDVQVDAGAEAAIMSGTGCNDHDQDESGAADDVQREGRDDEGGSEEDDQDAAVAYNDETDPELHKTNSLILPAPRTDSTFGVGNASGQGIASDSEHNLSISSSDLFQSDDEGSLVRSSSADDM